MIRLEGYCRTAIATATLALSATAFSLSTVRLEVAAQKSLSGTNAVLLIYSEPVHPTTAQPGNFSLAPARTIIEASVDVEASNVVRLQLDPSTPLDAGTTYQVQTLGGTDAVDENLDGNLTSGTFTARSMATEIANILACQIPDGAFSTNIIGDAQWRPGEPIRLVPYYGCLATQGLISAYRITRDQHLLDRARAYLVWHADRIPANGFITDYVGYYPTYQSTGTYDSTDSYGALFASTLWMYFQETQDQAFLQEMYPALQKSIGAIDATLQADSLTWATPDYHVKFTMDNAEVFQGYFAAAQLARRMGSSSQHALWLSRANAVRTAIHSNLYLDDLGRYSKGKSNTGNIYTNWDAYYPDAMANEFALYYTHLPQDPWFEIAWENEKQKFFPGDVPDPAMSASAALVAARAKDRLYLDLSYARALQNHEKNYYSQISAMLIELESIMGSGNINVPSIAPGAIVVDGDLAEPAWANATRLIFHKNGVMNGFANESTYEYPQNTIDPDGLCVVSWLHSGTMLYMGIDVDDKYITTADVATDSDGLSHLFIRNAATESVLHQATYTFFPNESSNTVPTAPPGTMLSNPAAATAGFSYKPGNNTPNEDSDIDTGYRLEIAIELTHPDAGGYVQSFDEIMIGMRLADMDGTPGEGWPWTNGAFGTMMQWAGGVAPADYSVNTLRLISMDQSAVHDWSIY